MGGCQKVLSQWRVLRPTGACSATLSLKRVGMGQPSEARVLCPVLESLPEGSPEGNSSPWVASSNIAPLYVTAAFGWRCSHWPICRWGN